MQAAPVPVERHRKAVRPAPRTAGERRFRGEALINEYAAEEQRKVEAGQEGRSAREVRPRSSPRRRTRQKRAGRRAG
ncbi:hypothetical protein ACRAWF_35050 [Streptomyces sp. L7]